MKVTTYTLTAANGRHIRKATRVILENGKHIDFMDLITKREAIAQVNYQIARHGLAAIVK